jgi:hypothetical protein
MNRSELPWRSGIVSRRVVPGHNYILDSPSCENSQSIIRTRLYSGPCNSYQAICTRGATFAEEIRMSKISPTVRSANRCARQARCWLAVIMMLTGPAAAGLDLPFCWQEMEIEAKWKISNRKFNEMRAAFSTQTGVFDKYKLDVRWDGHTKQFIDNFYDNSARDLGNALHTLRHRTRYGTADGENWQEVQYKSTPCFIEATWFRLERGDCRVSDEQGNDLCDTQNMSSREIISGKAPSHPAMAAVILDHPGIDPGALTQFLQVSTHRYRAQFLDGDDRPVFRITLDKVTRTAGNMHKLSFEAEIEMIDEHANEASVAELIRLSGKIEKKFSLGDQRLQVSKTGEPISDCPLPSSSPSTLAACEGPSAGQPK